MITDGIEGVLIETHNWGKTVAFWKATAYELEFETDHHSGRLRHPRGGPYLFVAERTAGAPLQLHPVLSVRDAAELVPSGSAQVVRPAVRVALWRALHVPADASPHVFEDKIGLALAAPDSDWQKRPDMSSFTRRFRASIVARALR